MATASVGAQLPGARHASEAIPNYNTPTLMTFLRTPLYI